MIGANTVFFNAANGDTIVSVVTGTNTVTAGTATAAVNGYTGDGVVVKANGKMTGATKIGTVSTIASTADTFAELRTQFAAGNLTASGNNAINTNVVVVAGDGGAEAKINGTYIIVNNTNQILD